MPHCEPFDELLSDIRQIIPLFVRQGLSFIIYPLFVIITLLNYNIFAVLFLHLLLPINALDFY